MINKGHFPGDFIWGVATSAFQIEGGAASGGRGQSVWDRFCEIPGVISDGSDGTVACDHYNRWESDLDIIRGLGVTAYRFSISWPRVQPVGSGPWNEEGFSFYEDLLKGLAKRGVQAHVTLNHWDLPQALEDQGGWFNRDTCERFVEFAIEVHRRFGSLISSICTHNEPWVVAILGHELGTFAPGHKSRSRAYQVAHHLLLSHGMAVQALRASGCSLPLGIVLNLSPIYPASDDPKDIEKAKIDDALNARWYLDAIFLGKYPDDALEYLGQDAPEIFEGDFEIISQRIDYLGINYYTRNFSSAGRPWDVYSTGNTVTDMGWEVYPSGLTELLVRLKNDYSPPPLWVTENGAAFKDKLENGHVHDAQRTEYLQAHIRAVWDAIQKGVNVGSYFAWSLMDNFEWASGYEKRFGIVYVDYETQERCLKDSAIWYESFLKGDSPVA
jgi:beta-glucosidase